MNDREHEPTICVQRGSGEWPDYAPSWAACAHMEPGSPAAATFEAVWSIPSALRDGDPFDVLRVRQRFEQDDSGTPRGGSPWVEAGPDALWADYRADQVAAVLRSLADALAPHSEGQSSQRGDSA